MLANVLAPNLPIQPQCTGLTVGPQPLPWYQLANRNFLRSISGAFVGKGGSTCLIHVSKSGWPLADCASMIISDSWYSIGCNEPSGRKINTVLGWLGLDPQQQAWNWGNPWSLSEQSWALFQSPTEHLRLPLLLSSGNRSLSPNSCGALKTSLSSHSTPPKLFPWSDMSLRGFPLQPENLWNNIRKEFVSIDSQWGCHMGFRIFCRWCAEWSEGTSELWACRIEIGLAVTLRNKSRLLTVWLVLCNPRLRTVWNGTWGKVVDDCWLFVAHWSSSKPPSARSACSWTAKGLAF